MQNEVKKYRISFSRYNSTHRSLVDEPDEDGFVNVDRLAAVVLEVAGEVEEVGLPQIVRGLGLELNPTDSDSKNEEERKM